MRTRQINIRLSDQEFSRLSRTAADEGQTVSQLVRDRARAAPDLDRDRIVKQSRVVVMVLHYDDFGNMVSSECEIRNVSWGRGKPNIKVVEAEAQMGASICMDRIEIK